MKELSFGQREWLRRHRGIQFNNTRGMNHRLRKLDDDMVREIKAMIRDKIAHAIIVEKMRERHGVQITPNCVSMIRQGRNWRHVK